MQQLIDRNQIQNNMEITLAKTKVKDYKLGNWIDSVSYMETNVTEAFRVAKDNKKQGRRGNRINISSVEGRGKGRGSRGRGLGQGRG